MWHSSCGARPRSQRSPGSNPLIRRLQLNHTYFAGKNGVRVVQQDGSESRIAEGYQVRFSRWPAKVDGEIIDSRGYVVQVVVDQMLRVAEDKALVIDS